jgi:hypothetical protein
MPAQARGARPHAIGRQPSRAASHPPDDTMDQRAVKNVRLYRSALRQAATRVGDDSRPAGRKERLSENAPEPAGYEAGLGARSREERCCAADDAPKVSRSPRLIFEGSHKLRLWDGRWVSIIANHRVFGKLAERDAVDQGPGLCETVGAASRRRAFCTLGSAAVAFVSGRARTRWLGRDRALLVGCRVAGLARLATV